MSLSDSIIRRAKTAGRVLDAVTEAVAPTRAARRRMARASAKVMAAYNAGSKRRRLSGWRGTSRSVNTETRRSLSTLRARSRDMVENDYWAKRSISVMQRNVIGTGIRPTVRDSEQMEAVVRAICDRTKLDVRGRETLYGLQSNIMHTERVDGECLIVRKWLTGSEMVRRGTPIPMQIKILEADHLDHLKDGVLNNGNKIIQGVEVDRDNRPIAYWLYPDHPGDMTHFSQFESVRVPARDVCHVFDELRPGQVRGIPSLAAVLVKIKDFGEFDDAQLQRQKIAAAYALFVQRPDGMAPHKNMDPNGVPEKVMPGTIEYLYPGESMEFASPPGVDGHEAYTRTSARAVAAGTDVTYEALTGDYSQVNYSSARMAWLEMHRAVTQLQSQMMKPQFCYRLEDWIREAAELVGIDTGSESWKWTAPKREMIDPVKEGRAAAQLIRDGLSDREHEINKMGRNVEDVNEAIARNNDVIDEMGFIFDTDPRKATAAGLTPQLVSEQIRQGQGEE